MEADSSLSRVKLCDRRDKIRCASQSRSDEEQIRRNAPVGSTVVELENQNKHLVVRNSSLAATYCTQAYCRCVASSRHFVKALQLWKVKTEFGAIGYARLHKRGAYRSGCDCDRVKDWACGGE